MQADGLDGSYFKWLPHVNVEALIIATMPNANFILIEREVCKTSVTKLKFTNMCKNTNINHCLTDRIASIIFQRTASSPTQFRIKCSCSSVFIANLQISFFRLQNLALVHTYIIRVFCLFQDWGRDGWRKRCRCLRV